MKRIAAEPFNRYDYPVTAATTGETASDAINARASWTMSELKTLAWRPLPDDLDLTPIKHALELAEEGLELTDPTD